MWSEIILRSLFKHQLWKKPKFHHLNQHGWLPGDFRSKCHKIFLASSSYETHAFKMLYTCDQTPNCGGGFEKLLVELLWYFSADMLESFQTSINFSAELVYVQMRPQTGKRSEKEENKQSRKKGPRWTLFCSGSNYVTEAWRVVCEHNIVSVGWPRNSGPPTVKQTAQNPHKTHPLLDTPLYINKENQSHSSISGRGKTDQSETSTEGGAPVL